MSRAFARIAATALLAALTTSVASAQATRLLDASAVTERDDHLDLALDFGCSLRYQTHSPASEGDRLTVRLVLGPECGLSPAAQFPVERMLPADTSGLVRSIELQPALVGGAELIVQFNRIEKFVLAPSSGMRGLRIRVTRKSPAQVLVNDTPAIPGSYAVNLASSREALDEFAVAKAAALLKAPVFVSQVKVDGQNWFRLRAGPFDSRREAEDVLREARNAYPAAWLGISDEPVNGELPADELLVLPSADGTPRAPETREDPALDQVLKDARTAMTRKRFDEVIAKLTPVLTAEDYVHRLDAVEMLGLARERKGQLAQAKSAYEEFLRRYPSAPAVPRIRQRLQTLRLSDLPGRNARGVADGSRLGWTVLTTASQIYRRDNSQLSTDAFSRDIITQNALLNDFDTIVRRRGERHDFISRVNFGYQKDLLTNGPGDQVRVSSAFGEWIDRELGIGARVGRQSRGMAGVNGTFDGAYANWQWRPQWGFGMTIGMPVESSRNGPQTDRRFLGVATDFTTRDRQWGASVFAIAQQYDGSVDRRSVGLEGRYLRPGRTLVALTDYDLHFGELNSVMLLGTLITDSRWTFNLDASRQRSPVLSLRNALIGQPTLAFDDLRQLFTDTELDQLALDRSAELTQASFTASRPLGERAQWTLNVSSTDLTGTPESGGVSAVLAPGRDDALTSELQMSSLMRAGDLHSVALRFQQGGTGSLMSLGLGSRMPIGSALRLTTRLRLDRRTQDLDDSRLWTLLPSVRLDYLRGRNSIEFEAGAEYGRRELTLQEERTTRLFFSLGYRLSLDWSKR